MRKCEWGIITMFVHHGTPFPIGKNADGHYTEESPFKDETTVFFILFISCFLYFERALLMSCFGIYLFCKRDAVREK